MSRVRSPSLLWQLYGVGLAQVVIVSLSAGVIGFLVARPRPTDRFDRLALEAAVQRVSPALGASSADGGDAVDVRALRAELLRLRERYDLELTLYDAQDEVIASNTREPLPLPQQHEPEQHEPDRERLRAPPDQRHAPDRPPKPLPGPAWYKPVFIFGFPQLPPVSIELNVRGERGTLVGRHAHRGPNSAVPALTFGFGLLVVGLGAWFMSRHIVWPIERLTTTARALGRGDLSARAELLRSDEIGELSRTFDDMAERLRNLVLAEKEMMANISHELKTPLARIRVALDLANEGDAEAARESLAEIALDLAELERLVDDVLTVTRLERAHAHSAPLPLRLEPYAPAELAEQSQSRVQSLHPERPIMLTVEAGDELPIIEVDPVLLRRVLCNLLENSHKYTLDPTSPIALVVRVVGDDVQFVVEDHGAGIADVDLPHVFTPFFRAERSRSRAAGGVGLGLTLVSRIVDAHGGRVQIQSTKAVGTRVTVSLPIAPKLIDGYT